jgi:hypothetical protein
MQIIWKCEQAWAGQLYNRMIFDSQKEAEAFVNRMQAAQPDQVFSFSIEAVVAKHVWN